MRFASLVILVGCASVEIPDIKPHITLPASKDGFWVSTLSDQEGTIQAKVWQKTLSSKAHIILFSDDWAKLRYTILKNCLTMNCKEAVGVFDELFITMDNALLKLKK